MIYLDSCAAIKLIIPEPESEALIEWLESHDEPLISSRLLRVELHRALTRLAVASSVRNAADEFLDGLLLRPVDPVLATAAAFDGTHLRSLDAIHLATALDARIALTAFVTYDKRLADAATEAELPVEAPA
ncbi:ribonuclease VapC [Saccharopolyspora subtropica]|uniref:Ribonuclease VapC n=1 Tax=Saccharopolyspora thermophila TaxID=89367 RepID=A0A917K1F1_9PSEU|nr:type II toxin-antitoxin system VapC family toxin [Saccharopolyspora subtropica]GGI94913.1 ribonuclease VapC [Saccharopolyspora subtropica]